MLKYNLFNLVAKYANYSILLTFPTVLLLNCKDLYKQSKENSTFF